MHHQQTSWSHTARFAHDPASAARARDFVRARLLGHGLPTLVDDLRLVTSELATNAMQHAETPFRLTLAREGHSVTLSVQDGSSGLPRLGRLDTEEPRGRGLALVDQLSVGWGVELETGASKVVWARFDTGRTMSPDW